MLMFDENSINTIVESINGPFPSTHFWVFDTAMMDFTLTKLNHIEHVRGPALGFVVGGSIFYLPSHWHAIIYDVETSQMDSIPLSETCGRSFMALSSGPSISTFEQVELVSVDYQSNYDHVYPALLKKQFLCHPISHVDPRWICVGPYNNIKLFKNATIGDLQ